MTTLTRNVSALMLVGALFGAVATTAFAQGDFREGLVMMVAPSGEVLEKQKADIAFLSMATKDVLPVPPGTMLVMHGGKLYVITDKKMADGHMMSEMAFSPH